MAVVCRQVIGPVAILRLEQHRFHRRVILFPHHDADSER